MLGRLPDPVYFERWRALFAALRATRADTK